MTRSLRFTRAEIENAARVVREHGVAVRLVRDGSLVLLPAPPLDTTAEDDLDAELEAWRKKHGGGGA